MNERVVRRMLLQLTMRSDKIVTAQPTCSRNLPELSVSLTLIYDPPGSFSELEVIEGQWLETVKKQQQKNSPPPPRENNKNCRSKEMCVPSEIADWLIASCYSNLSHTLIACPRFLSFVHRAATPFAIRIIFGQAAWFTTESAALFVS